MMSEFGEFKRNNYLVNHPYDNPYENKAFTITAEQQKMEKQDKIFILKDIEKFVKDHMQSKIDNHELGMAGIDMANPDNFKREFEIYKNALFEGICNGILMCGYGIEGIDL